MMAALDFVERLVRSLDDSMKDLTEGLSRVGISFSGGLDSSIIATLASKYTNPRLYVVGVEGSPDILNARSASETLNLPLVESILTEDAVRDMIPEVVQIIRTKNPVLVSYKLPEYSVSEVAEEKVILLGNGADELFGGYSRYTKMRPDELRNAMESDLTELLMNEIPMDNRIARLSGKIFEYPFLSAGVVEVAMDTPLELKVKGEERKIVLRGAGKRLLLSDEIWTRKKRAVQYGSGTIKLMRRVAKAHGLSISQYLDQLTSF